MYIDMNSQDELKIRFGEIVGLCYIIKVGLGRNYDYRNWNSSLRESKFYVFV